jgi:phosphatidylglycerol:prolipoprotein diacylglycerol transferase
MIATLIYLRRRHLPLLRTLNAWAPCATLIWAFLALGHFAEGSDPGLPTTLPWGLPIPPDTAPRLHPVALYAAIVAAIITVLLLRQLTRSRYAGSTAAAALAAAGIAQFLLTFFRQPNPYPMPLGNLLDPIQWIALGMIVAAVLIFILQPRKQPAHAV